jgi:hypothetical protein
MEVNPASGRRLHRTALAAAAILCLCAVLGTHAHALEYKSKYCTVIYDKASQLEKFADKVTPGAVTRTLNRILVSGRGRSKPKDFGRYLDHLMRRVQILLDMRMPKMRIKIRLFNNVDGVVAAYKKATGGKAYRYQNPRPPAFYWNQNKTIYIQTQRVSVGMLAHEMGHAVQYHFFGDTPPPLKVQEMLCMYVDREISSGRH